MDDYTEARLTEFIEKSDRDLTVEEIEPAFNDKLDTIEERAMESLDDQTKVDYAVSMLSSEDLRESRVGADGEKMELKVLSIGHRGVWEDHPVFEEDILTAHGIIHGPIASDGSEKAAKAIFFLSGEDIDLLDAKNKFHALNELKATFEVEEAWELNGFYRVHSSEQTDLTEVELDDLPQDRDAKNELLRKMFPDVKLSELAEDGTGLSAFDPESGNTQDWGADIKRFTGTIAEYYINDERTWGVYTVTDDTVTPEDIEGTRLIGENQNVPGLSVHCEPDYHMNYGRQSVVDIYGVTEVTNDGQIIMRAAGVVPIVPTEMDDGETADDGVEATETSI